MEYRLGSNTDLEKVVYYQQMIINYLLDNYNTELSTLMTDYLYEKTVETIYSQDYIRKLKNHMKGFNGSESEFISEVADFLYKYFNE